MEKKEQMYEGKAKKVFATDDDNCCIVSYKDDATAFNGLKKGTITGKGVVNNKMSNYLMQLLEKQGIPTHYIEELNDRETLVKKVSIVPLEVIVRNVAAGSFSKRLGVAEGSPLKCPILEYCYKDDDLGDPMVNDYHILAMGYATKEELMESACRGRGWLLSGGRYDTDRASALILDEFRAGKAGKITLELPGR